MSEKKLNDRKFEAKVRPRDTINNGENSRCFLFLNGYGIFLCIDIISLSISLV